jgi:hypothetical protein
MTDDHFSADDVRLLLDLCFVAAGRAAVDDTDAMAEGLLALRPGLEGPELARALARLNAGQADEAVTLLRARRPTSADARPLHDAVLGLALQLAGRSGESRRVLEQAASMPGAGLARALLGLPQECSA